MEIILIQDVDNLGAKNEVIKVKNGYARNFLLPRQLAVESSLSNRKQLEERMKQLKKKEDKMLAEINSVIAKLKEHQMQNKITDFFPTYYQIILGDVFCTR